MNDELVLLVRSGMSCNLSKTKQNKMEGDCESKENAFISLPPEVIMGIFLELPIPDGARLAQTCKKLHSVFSIELFWEKKILREFGIDLSRSSQKCDEKYPSHFYKSVLHKYGQVLGLWQRTSFSYYGSMVQVTIFEKSFGGKNVTFAIISGRL